MLALGRLKWVSPDLKEQLRRQLGFLSRSCESYDYGYADEVSRIAAALRVLLHDTRHSTSLLTHLGAKGIRILSTVDHISDNAIMADQTGLIKIDGQGNVSLVPKLDMARVRTFMLSDDWWNQIFYVRGALQIRRRDVILAAANKDGGAHGNPVLTPEYLELQGGMWSKLNADNTETRIEQQQFVFLRQAGYEILNSPELVALSS